ncbi:hypothetical protein ABTK54_19980, partial [Acinetobacter baumannii]
PARPAKGPEAHRWLPGRVLAAPPPAPSAPSPGLRQPGGTGVGPGPLPSPQPGLPPSGTGRPGAKRAFRPPLGPRHPPYPK